MAFRYLAGSSPARQGGKYAPLSNPGGRPKPRIGGASERSIMRQTGHRSVQMVLRYGSLFRENAAAKVGL
jgi:hypothetical protein